MPRFALVAAFALVGFGVSGDARATIIYSDSTVDSGGDWSFAGSTASFWNSASADPYFTSPGSGSGVLAGSQSILLSPTSGAAYLDGGTTGLTLQPGAFKISGWVGNPNNTAFPAPYPTSPRFRLYPSAGFGNIDALNGYVTSADTPSPGPGQWEFWTVSYIIPKAEPLIGSQLNFIVQTLTAGRNMTFDGPFTIEQLPEPSTFGLAALGFCGLIRRRRRVKNVDRIQS